MIIKRNCIFLLDKEKSKSDAKLRYRIKWNGNTVSFNVGYRVDIDKWSPDGQRCKNNTTHSTKKVHSSVINKAMKIYVITYSLYSNRKRLYLLRTNLKTNLIKD